MSRHEGSGSFPIVLKPVNGDVSGGPVQGTRYREAEEEGDWSGGRWTEESRPLPFVPTARVDPRPRRKSTQRLGLKLHPHTHLRPVSRDRWDPLLSGPGLMDQGEVSQKPVGPCLSEDPDEVGLVAPVSVPPRLGSRLLPSARAHSRVPFPTSASLLCRPGTVLLDGDDGVGDTGDDPVSFPRHDRDRRLGPVGPEKSRETDVGGGTVEASTTGERVTPRPGP